MKKFLFILFSVVMFTSVQAQKDTVDVQPGVGTLNAAIETALAGGDAAISNTVFRLARVSVDQGVTTTAVYPLTASITNATYSLDIVAAEGDGPRPILLPYVEAGGTPSRAFDLTNDIILKGLYITNRDVTGVNGVTRIIRCNSVGIKVVVDDCMLENDYNMAFRLDQDDVKLFITNTIVANIGLPSDPDNGRVIDDRGHAVDSLVVKNCTFYNITSRILRDGGGLNNYIEFDHNTFVNIGSRSIVLGETIKTKITNNIFIDCAYLGYSAAGSPEFIIQLDPLGVGVEATQECVISNNNIFNTPSVLDALPETVSPNGPFNELAASFADDTNISEAVMFSAGVPLPTPQIAYRTTPDNVPDFDRPASPTLAAPYAFDFGYPTSATSYSAAIGGKPLGDLNWINPTTGLRLTKINNPIAISCFPNPVKNHAYVSFQLKSNSYVNLDVINLNGAVAKSIYSGFLSAGVNHFEVSTNNLQSGMYFIRLVNNNNVNVQKVIVQ